MFTVNKVLFLPFNLSILFLDLLHWQESTVMLNPQYNSKNRHLYLVSSQKRSSHYFTIKYDISCRFFRSPNLNWCFQILDSSEFPGLQGEQTS